MKMEDREIGKKNLPLRTILQIGHWYHDQILVDLYWEVKKNKKKSEMMKTQNQN